MTFLVQTDDAVTFLDSLKTGSVDLIVTDPAYESLEKHRAKGTTTRLKKEWFPIFANERFPEFFRACFRALKKNAHCYVICDQETMFVIKPMGEAAGFTFWKPIVWDKRKIGMGYHYRNRCEFVLFFEKGKRKINDLSTPDVLAFESVRNGYPTEKPIGLLQTLIRQSSEMGELVADPFLGSGSTGQAAILAGRRFVGCDVSSKAVDAARIRLENTPFIGGTL